MVVDEATKIERYVALSSNIDGQHRYVMRHRNTIELDGVEIQSWRAFDRRLERWLFDLDVVRIPAAELQERLLNG